MLTNAGADSGLTLYDFLKTKVTEGTASLVLTQIFDPVIKKMESVHIFKDTLEKARSNSTAGDPQTSEEENAKDSTPDKPH